MTSIEEKNESKNLSRTEELAQLNKLFAKRYTNEDQEYIQMAEACFKTPPIVNDWGEDKNNYRNQGQRYYNNHQQNRNSSRDDRYRRDRSRSPSYYQDRHR